LSHARTLATLLSIMIYHQIFSVPSWLSNIGAGILAFVLSLFFGHFFIIYAQRLFRAKSRAYTPESHRAKDNTPTMGGIFLMFVIVLTTLLWGSIAYPSVLIVLVCMLMFSGIGGWDDWCKIYYNEGISARKKFSLQIVAAAIVMLLLRYAGVSSVVFVPFFPHWSFDLGPFFVLWGMFILVACSNAVNLTDGLDGLAVGSLIPNFCVYAVIALYTVPSLAIVGAIITGTLGGFLYYNRYPARIFMSDVGSLALGAGLGCMVLLQKVELLLVLTGIIFVAETVSVIIQVASYKMYKKRFFKMAPIHHHFELNGFHETTVTTVFSAISGVICGAVILLFYYFY
jgi:phospho-N-acetylmuramoyl-pentapeptide-transferase